MFHCLRLLSADVSDCCKNQQHRLQKNENLCVTHWLLLTFEAKSWGCYIQEVEEITIAAYKNMTNTVKPTAL